jgi:CHAT domain-containing protein/tetratricopeptide (TPR) repeat protein
MCPFKANPEVTAPQVLHLEAGLEGDRVRISLAAQRSGEMQTMRQVEELSVAMSRIDQRCRAMVQFLNQANRQGRLTPEVLSRLQETGQLFRDELFSTTIKTRLQAGPDDALILTLDDALAHIPWELLHDGQSFLGQGFAMGRVVRTRRPVAGMSDRPLVPPLHLLVLADPGGDLQAAYDEGIAIRDLAEPRPDLLEVFFRSSGVQPDFVKAKLRRFDLVHFAGHADCSDAHGCNAGWRLSRGQLTATDIQAMAGTGRMPAMIFANACQSARTSPASAQGHLQEHLFDLAHAFLSAGVKHYLGTFWDIPDAAGRLFAIEFYRALLAGRPIGAAVLAARRGMIERFGEQSVIWAGYLLYGDPTTVYFRKAAGAPDQPTVAAGREPAQPMNEPARVRSPEDVLNLSASGRAPCFKGRIKAVAAALLIAAALAAIRLLPGGGHDAGVYEQKALAAFRAGHYDQVEQVCTYLQREQPQRPLSYVLLANVHFYQGDLEQAHALYQQAAHIDQGPETEKAEALIGLGRIASERGETDKALDFYRRASHMAPDNEHPLVAQALLLGQSGRPDQAMEVLHRARAITSDPQSLDALTLQIQTDAALAADQQRQARIDQLIQELTARIDEGQAAPAKTPPLPANRPLTIWLSDLQSVGYSLQEGTAALLLDSLAGRLLQTRQMKLVERGLLEGVMHELKLGSSKLADAAFRLQLGRLTAAHIIVAGRVVHSPPNRQVTLRCIETDSGQIFAVINADFEERAAVSTMADRLADELIANIRARYPAQGVDSEMRNPPSVPAHQ